MFHYTRLPHLSRQKHGMIFGLFVAPWKYQTQVVTPDGHVSTDVPEVLDVAGQLQVLLVLLVLLV